MRSAAGSEADSHGSSEQQEQPERRERCTEAPRQPTHAVARTTINAAEMDSGRSATRESPAPVTASVPCDNHAASAVARSAITRSEA